MTSTLPRRAWHSRKLRSLVLGLTILLVGLLFWRGWLRHQWPKNWGEVVPGKIYRSGQNSPYCIERVLREHKIKRVIFMSTDQSPANHVERVTCEKLGIERFNLPLDGDGIGNIRRYAEAIALMVEAEKQGRPVLVHCEAGAQRTGGVVAAYRVLAQGRPVAEAYREMRQFGHDPKDNTRLVPYLDAKMPLLARLLKERGIIEQVPASLAAFGPIALAEGQD